MQVHFGSVPSAGDPLRAKSGRGGGQRRPLVRWSWTRGDVTTVFCVAVHHERALPTRCETQQPIHLYLPLCRNCTGNIVRFCGPLLFACTRLTRYSQLIVWRLRWRFPCDCASTNRQD